MAPDQRHTGQCPTPGGENFNQPPPAAPQYLCAVDVQGDAASVRQRASSRAQKRQFELGHHLRKQRQVAGKARVEDRLNLRARSWSPRTKHREAHHHLALGGDGPGDRHALRVAFCCVWRARDPCPEAVGVVTAHEQPVEHCLRPPGEQPVGGGKVVVGDLVVAAFYVHHQEAAVLGGLDLVTYLLLVEFLTPAGYLFRGVSCVRYRSLLLLALLF